MSKYETPLEEIAKMDPKIRPVFTNNLKRFHYYINIGINDHGEEIMKTFGKFVVYEVKVGDEIESICMDFKNKYNNGK